MRILYATYSLPLGAGEPFVLPEVAALRERGHAVRVVPFDPRGEPVHGDVARELARDPLVVPIASGAVAAGALITLLRRPLRTLQMLRVLLRSRSPLRVRLAAWAKGLWLAREASRWGADHMHAHWSNHPSSMAMVAGHVSGIPWSFAAHRYDLVENVLLDEKVRRACFARVSSSAGRRLLAERVPDLDARRVVTLHVGATPPLSGPGASADGAPVVMVPASLDPVKGHRYLLEAVALLVKRGVALEVRCFGDGPLRDELEATVGRLGIDRHVAFLGHRPHADLLAAYRGQEVAVMALPSIDLGGGVHEGSPVSIVEALAHGVPVVSTRTGGIPELIEDGGGVLVPDKDAEALADALEPLLRDPDLRARIGRDGEARFHARFSTVAIAAELERLFGECASTES